MTANSPSVPTSLFHKLGLLLTGSSKSLSTRTQSPDRIQPQTLSVEIVPPFAVLTTFDDYAAEGDEPADLALQDLIPAGLSELDLPQPHSASKPLQPATDKPPSCPLPARPLTDDEQLSADMNELTPAGLSQLNLSIAKVPSKQHPLPDLSALSRSQNSSHLQTFRVPTQYLQKMDDIVTELTLQQTRQARHNEQLGTLVKELLSRVAQQKQQLNALGLDTRNDIQALVQTCLASTEGMNL